MEITKKQLITAAKDMNVVMELEPPIDISAPLDELLSQLGEAINEVDPADEFSKETWEIINAYNSNVLKVKEGGDEEDLKQEPQKKIKEKSKKGKSKDKSKKKSKEKSVKRRLEKNLKFDFDSDIKDIVIDCKLNPYNRCSAVLAAFLQNRDSEIVFDDLVSLADSIYMDWSKKGSNKREQACHTKRTLTVLILSGIIRVDNGKFKLQ